MIRVDNDFVIRVDENNYMPCVDLHKTVTDKKGNEKDTFDIIGYYNTLFGAIKGLLDYKVRKLLSDDNHTLESALKCVERVYGEFDALVEKIMKQKGE